MSALIGAGAAELARRIRAGEATPLEVVDAHIARIEEVEPQLNAFITTTFDKARDEARRKTEEGVPADAPPLYGVPITVKDAIAVGGVRFTAGSTFHRDDVATEDAEAVRRLKAAGAIVLGKTSCPDMSGSAETRNLIIGQTRNPWNPDRSPGGSSGGEGAVIAAGGSPLGLGSDIAGSVRIPAAFCGLVGLKPTAKRISTAGHVPGVPPSLDGLNTIGPLARRIEDLQLALRLLSDTEETAPTEPELRERALIVPTFLGTPPVTAEIASAVDAAAEALTAAGMKRASDLDLPIARVVYETTAVMHREWLAGYRRDLGGGRPVSLLREMFASLRGRSQISSNCLVPVASVALGGRILRLAGYGRPGALDALRQQCVDTMQGGALALCPVFPSTAPPHGFAASPSASPAYTSAFNGLGFPAVAVPVGLSAEGLPLAVQVVARPGEDEVALAAAAILERDLGGCPVPPL